MALSATRSCVRGAKIDSFCHIAHNCDIGEDTLVASHAMLGGSLRVGRRCWLGPATVFRDGLEIGDDAYVGLGALVVKDVAERRACDGLARSRDRGVQGAVAPPSATRDRALTTEPGNLDPELQRLWDQLARLNAQLREQARRDHGRINPFTENLFSWKEKGAYAGGEDVTDLRLRHDHR